LWPFASRTRIAVRAELDVLHAQPQALEQPHAAPVEKRRDELRRPAHPADQGANLRSGQHRRQTLRPLRTNDGLERRQRLLEHVSVEEEQRGQRLVLRGGADPAVDGEVGEEGVDLRLAHLDWMPLAVKDDKAPDPRDVGLLGSETVVTRPDRQAHPVEEPWFPATGVGQGSPGETGHAAALP